MKYFRYIVSLSLLLVSFTLTAQTETRGNLKVTADSLMVDADGMTVGTLRIYQTDTCHYAAFNMTLELPQGLRVVQTEGQYHINLSDRLSATHQVYANHLSEGNLLKVLVSVPEVKEFAPGSSQKSDPLLTIDFVAQDMEAGTYDLFLSGMKFVLPNGRAYLPEMSEVRVIAEVKKATGIEGVDADADSDIYYDMSGRRVLHPHRGVYIKNNKKVWLQQDR